MKKQRTRHKTTTLRGLAKLLHVSHSAIRKAISNGRLERCVGRDTRGRPTILDTALA
jgi:hypothetical protein